MEKPSILLIDNFDSFTYNLVDYLYQAGATCKVYRNNIPLTSYTSQKFDGVLLSPGPSTPTNACYLMNALHFYENRLPILGICLGHQAIGEYFGWKLVKATKPMHGKISTISCEAIGPFEYLPPELEVVRYHSLVLRKQDHCELKAIAHTQSGEIMGLMHQTKPIWGLQFHPEAALTQHGLQMIKNWVDSLKVF